MNDLNATPQRAVVLSIGLGGFDGVSVEADRWLRSCGRLGLPVLRAAGHFYDHTHNALATPADVLLPSLWRPANTDGTFGPTPQVTTAEIDALLNATQGSVLIVDNAATLPTAPDSMRTLLAAVADAQVPMIVRHHDPEWDSPTFRDQPTHGFPLNPPGSRHVAISTHVQRQLRARRNIDSTVIFNAVDITPAPEQRRHEIRTERGIDPTDIVLLHPVTPYPRKNVPAALLIAADVARLTDRRVIYWLTGGHPDTLGELPDGVHLATGRCQSQADMYAAADAVLLPSHWEGWGNPVAEAACLDLPVVTGHWPALDDMRALGLHDIPAHHANADDTARRLLHTIDHRTTGHDTERLRDALSPSTLDDHLGRLLNLHRLAA